MSKYFKSAAASDIAAAFCALPASIAVSGAVSPQRTRMTGTGLSNVVFGEGHPPRGIPL
ncbi:MAG: hypothetical protein ACJ74U_11050 [Jatrophihabitantaceae bacterium]